METSTMPQQVEWNIVLVDVGELCVIMPGEILMLQLCVDNLD